MIPDDYEDDGDDIANLYDDEIDAMENCMGHYGGPDGEFVCGMIGSEQCEFECPFNRDLGLTLLQAQARDVAEICAKVKAEREAAGNAEYDSWLNAMPSTGTTKNG